MLQVATMDYADQLRRIASIEKSVSIVSMCIWRMDSSVFVVEVYQSFYNNRKSETSAVIKLLNVLMQVPLMPKSHIRGIVDFFYCR